MDADEFLPCSSRKRMTAFQADGSKVPLYRCAETSAPDFNRDVTPEVCAACPVRAALTQAAIENKTYRPPNSGPNNGLTPDKNPGREWLPCSSRKVTTVNSCCGQTEELRICDSIDCPRIRSVVTPIICRDCIHRTP